MTRAATRAAWLARLRGAGAAPRQPVAVHIAEFHAAGFSRTDARWMADAVRESLAAQIAARGVPDAWMRQPSVERMAPSVSVGGTGAAVGRAILNSRPGGRP